ncbi:LysR family transcriptional regulator [Thalassotalea crassostreae]|uniref:LysR family transcriptional regulator n=1 Tax=Thalassotalea crassostreae TaxID=1763536 RepID=UPI000838B9E6|nr:LysR family transcriptional regulator [Thalassotalea crassostreae]
MGGNSQLLDGMVVFVTVAETLSFTKAAQVLSHSPSYISKEMNQLEQRMAVQLLHRTTRSISLTEEGHQYYLRCRQIVDDANLAQASLSRAQHKPSGLLRINAPEIIAESHLNDLIGEFLNQYEDINVVIDLSDELVNIVEESYDLAIRIGKLKDSNLIAKKLMDTRLVTVASPSYLKRYGKPIKHSELNNHKCISYRYQPNPKVWSYTIANGKEVSIPVTPRVVCNNASLQLSISKMDAGIVRMPLFYCQQAIDNGELELIFDDYPSAEIGVYAVYPHKQFLATKVKVFIDFMANALAADY